MAAPTLFKVLTEFRFDIANAVIGSQTLAREVDKVSGAADRAIISLTNLSLKFAASFGLGTTGVVGLLGQGVLAADKFHSSALQFSSILSGNMEHLQGDVDDFNKRLQFSKQFLEGINKFAFKFGLPGGQLEETAKNLAGALIPKGLAGENLENVGDFARNIIKAAPVLNLDVGNIQNQLINALLGGASLQGQLFRRLVAETSALAPFGGTGGTKRFNELDAKRRFELLSKAFSQFTDDSKVLEEQANTLSGVFNRMTIITSGALSIFKPFGDVILPTIIMLANRFIEILNTKGRKVFQNLATLLKGPLADPKGTLTNLLQIKELSNDLGKAAGIVGIVVAIFHIKELIKFLKNMGPIIGDLMAGTAAATAAGGAAAGSRFAIGSIFTLLAAKFKEIIQPAVMLKIIINLLKFAVSKVLLPLTALLSLMQVITRAQVKAKIADALELPDLLVRLSQIMKELKPALSILMEPFVRLLEFFSDLIAPIFSQVFWLKLWIGFLEFATDGIKALAKGFVFFQAVLNGVIAVLMNNLQSLGRGGLFGGLLGGLADFGRSKETFTDAFKSVLEEKLDPATGNLKELSVTNQTNIDKIEIKNDFKQKIEPDRVAFALVDQLNKVAQNPLAAKGRSLRPIEGQ